MLFLERRCGCRVLWAALPLAAAMLLAASAPACSATLEVGPGKTFSRIEDALARAQPGDTILVYPLPDGRSYLRTAVNVHRPRLTFRGVPQPGQQWVKISGRGFSYSGAGSTPRAIFQFNRGADHCLIEGFELADAHNDTHNGAGVRINQANHVTVRNCSIHDNDMGIMSGGDGSLHAGVDQRIEHCLIYRNGSTEDPGHNHNLYLGGTSVTLRFCEVHSSTTGHNVKSRAHYNRSEYCYIHHSANREFDLVDAAETALPHSHTVLLGNVIVKDPQCRGNRAVIHFGQDGGQEHNGTLHVAFNTIVTPFMAPVVELSAPKTAARLMGNLISDGGVRQAGQTVASARGGARLQNVTGSGNWFSGDFAASASGTGLSAQDNTFRRASFALFVAPQRHDYRLTAEAIRAAAAPLAPAELNLPAVPGMSPADALEPLAWQYQHPAGKAPRPAQKPTRLGAIGR